MAAVAVVPDATGTRDRARWLRKARDLTGTVIKTALTPHRASLARLADMPLSVVGTGGIDFAAFHVDHGVGWLVLGVSLWVIEHLIADDVDGGPA
jgi:hypothetical protein